MIDDRVIDSQVTGRREIGNAVMAGNQAQCEAEPEVAPASRRQRPTEATDEATPHNVAPATRRRSRGRPAPGCTTTVSAPSHARDAIRRWLKFNFVGAIGIVIQLAALTLFHSGLHLDYLPATALAVEAAVIHNFLWHERFTWRDRPSAHAPESLRRFLKFNATNGAVSIVGNLAIMRALVGGLQMNYVAANLIAVAVCSVANFLLSDRVVFDSGTVREG